MASKGDTLPIDALLEKQQRLIEAEKQRTGKVEEAYNAVLRRWQPQIKLSTYVFHNYDEHYLGIKITDNADGIPEEIQSRIFEPFFTTKSIDKGTGLGLAISYQIVTKHDGKIWVDSTPETGTTFEILLPLDEHESSE